MLDADERETLIRRHFVERYSGWRSWATASGSMPSIVRYSSRSVVNARYASAESRSPRWGERTAPAGVATQKVFFRSAPAATSGRAETRGSRSGTKPRDRRTGNSRRTTESSQRRWMGRSCERKASAIPPSRSRASPSSNAIGSSERFPLVITSGRPTSWQRRWWSGVYGSSKPSQGVPGATDAATAASGRRHTSTIGRRASSRSARSSGPIEASASGSVVISANGFSSRCLRARSRATALSSVASQARWYPPRPLTARIAPSRSSLTASSSGPRRA